MSSGNDTVQERRRRTIEFGYRVCGLVEGVGVDGRPRICVMPRGHQTSPHRDADGIDFEREIDAAEEPANRR